MDCEWCGKSTIYFNHTSCFDHLMEVDEAFGDILFTSEDPWAAMLLGEEVPDA